MNLVGLYTRFGMSAYLAASGLPSNTRNEVIVIRGTGLIKVLTSVGLCVGWRD